MTERQMTERQKTQHQMTEHQMTERWMIERRMAERRITERRMTKGKKKNNDEWLNAERTQRRKWQEFWHITFIYSKHCLAASYYDITIRLG
jgi:hypothetical protein